MEIRIMARQEYDKRDYQAQMDAHQMDALQQEQAEQEAKDAGYCYHCGAEIDDCPGYKCWKR
jgi:hypothetical protein